MASPLYHYVAPIEYRSKLAPNILARLQLPKQALDNRTLFHPYFIKDDDRPETIAYHYYGNELYDWVVLLSNQIVNIRDAWPLSEQQFSLAIKKKYGSIPTAMAQIVHYEIDTDIPNINAAGYEALPIGSRKYWTRAITSSTGTVYGLTREPHKINADSFAILPAGEQAYWRAVDAFTYEQTLNDAKRIIKLIDAQYVPQLEKSLRQLSRAV
jgi:hypothetical protein